MFEDSLLIIKPDYLHKRRPVLLHLLSCGFQIQGNRRLNFSPELAAEFYADYVDEKGFMLDVIILSKGVSEAFILTKDNGVQELLNLMICYFGSSSEMERNIHVTKNARSVAREITFIFPNYIHEPFELFDPNTFGNRPMIKPLISEIYDIMQNVDCSQEDWKRRVSEYLVRSNPSLPQISNQCQLVPDLGMQEKGQQTTIRYKTVGELGKPQEKAESSVTLLSSSTPHSSLLLTSSSCVSCGGFERTQPSIPELDLNKRVEPQSDEPICVDEEIIWKEIIVFEEVTPEEESEHKSEDELPEEEGQHQADDESESEDQVKPAVKAVIETDSAGDEEGQMDGELEEDVAETAIAAAVVPSAVEAPAEVPPSATAAPEIASPEVAPPEINPSTAEVANTSDEEVAAHTEAPSDHD